jgi:ABC-2 type transport system permease protein
MTPVAAYALAISAVVRRDAIIFFSSRLRVVSQVAVALLSVTLFYYISQLVGGRRFSTPDEYFAYVVVGLAMLHLITATLALVPLALRNELVEGTFERLAVSPVGPAGGVAAFVIFPTAVALALGCITISVAALAFNMPVSAASALLAIPVAVLAAIAFLPFSLLVLALVVVAKQAGNFGTLVVLGLSLAGGVYYPPELMPSWLHWIADVQPYTPTLELMREVLIQADGTRTPTANLLRVIGFTLVLLPTTALLLQACVQRCRRRGTLTEY